MEAGLLSKLPNKTLVMSNKNQFPFSFTCLASKLFLLWMTSRMSRPMFEFFCLPQRPLNRLVHKRSVPARGLLPTQCNGLVVWCVVRWPRPSARDCSASQTALCCHFSRSSHNRLVSKLPLYIALGSPLVSVWTLYVGYHDSNQHTCWWGRPLSQTPYRRYL